MTLTELIAQLEQLNEEIGCDGEKIGSHHLKSKVYFTIENSDVEIESITSIEPTLLPGCWCWDGVRITLKAEELK